jgi:hypothetical protein
MATMKRLTLFLILAGCSSPPSPGASDRMIVTGFPGKQVMSVNEGSGRWDGIDHWIFDPKDKKEHDPSNGGARMSIFRDSLPFPQFTWGSGDFDVTQLVFPFGDGFIARYHVMNHGEESRSVRLVVGSRDGSAKLPPLQPSINPTEKTNSRMGFDLTIQPGASEFIVLSTAGAIRDPNDALDEAVATWEKLLARPITIADPAALSAYCRDLAGRVLAAPGSDEAVRKFEERFVKKEGDALRLLGEVPLEWLLETIDVKGLKTDFGPLTFRHVGFYNSRTLDLEPGCAPPKGFLIAVDSKHSAKIDGAPTEVKDGTLRVPAGARRVELARRY